MNYHQYYSTDMLNGEGLRSVLFVAGCNHGCKGCYNESTWNPNSGNPFTKELEDQIISDLKDERIKRDGITFSGGDPLHERNLPVINALANRIRAECPDKTIWCWTGYTLDEIYRQGDHAITHAEAKRLQVINKFDVLVDGKFVQSLHHPSLKWRGSENQKVWRRENGKWRDITPTDDITDEERKKLHNVIEIKIL